MKKEKNITLLVNYLLKHNSDWISGTVLKDYLQISIRQIRNYISDLNEQCPNLIQSCEYGYWLNPTTYEFYLRSKDDHVSQRQHDIIHKLCFSHHPIDIYDLEDFYGISVPCLESDITSLKTKLYTYHLHIQRKKNFLNLIGEEINIRYLLCELYYKKHQSEFILEGHEISNICRSILHCLHQVQIPSSSMNIEFLAIYLFITKTRLEHQFVIKTLPTNTFSSIPSDLFDIVLHRKNVSNGELYNLDFIVNNLTYPTYINDSTKIKVSACYQSFMKEFPFLKFKSTDFQSLLSLWYENELQMRNLPMFQVLEKTLRYSYPFASLLALRIHNYLSFNYQDSSLYSLTLLIQSNMVDCFQLPKIHAIFVTTELFPREDTLKEEIEARLPSLNIMKQVLWYQYRQDMDSCDLILSSYEMLFTKPCFHLHRIPTQDDYLQLSKTILHMQHKKKRKQLLKWLSCLPSYIYFSSLSIIEQYPTLIEIPNEGIQIGYLPLENTPSFFHLYVNETFHYHKIIFGISYQDIYAFSSFYQELIAVFSDAHYLNMLFPCRTISDFIKNMDQVIALYYKKCE